MSEGTKIEWATHTFNPWIGCTKVSPGCANCYAEMTTRARVLRSQGQETWGKGKPRSRTSAATWRNPVKWNRGPFTCDTCHHPFEQLTGRQKLCEPVPGVNCQRRHRPPDWEAVNCPGQYARPRVFPSLCDWLDDEVPVEWLADFLKLIHDTPNLDWLLLTKRPENFQRRMTEVWRHMPFGAPEKIMVMKWSNAAHSGRDGFHEPPANVWVGTSVEDQKRAEERIPELLNIPAAVRFLSVEPLLGAVNVAPFLLSDYDKRCFDSQMIVSLDTKTDNKVNWVIVGGESGPKARPCNVSWVRDIVEDCNSYGCPCFVKQLGAVPYWDCVGGLGTWAPHVRFFRGKQGDSIKLQHPKGGDPAEWPEDLRVREFPSLSSK